jgi:hypothetical protein
MKKKFFIAQRGFVGWIAIGIVVMTFLFPVKAAKSADEQQWKTHREDVRMIQKYLKKKGYNPGRIDGLLGSKTTGAIVAYQAEKGLATHGKITEELVARILSQVKVPEDFFIWYSSGPAHADWGGGIEVTVKANGDYLVTRQKGWRAGRAKETLAEGRLTPARMKMMYTQAISCGVFSLKKHYRNPRIIDGTVKNIRFTANGKSHSVSSANTCVGGIYCIALVLKAAIPSAKENIR